MAGIGRQRILVVDDDEQLRDLLVLVLGSEGYHVHAVADGPSALAAVDAGGIDLVVLDVSLAQGDGRVVLADIRARTDLPVVMISAHGEIEDRVLGLRLGADDYLSKPFAPVELVARVATVLRRVAPAGEDVDAAVGSGPEAEAGRLVVDELTREVLVDGRKVELTAREFDVLAFMARHPRQVFTRGQLLEHVWASRPEWQDEATVTEHIRRVRRKIEPNPDRPRWVVTVRGVGYRYQP